jgi:hypothetical protein
MLDQADLKLFFRTRSELVAVMVLVGGRPDEMQKGQILELWPEDAIFCFTSKRTNEPPKPTVSTKAAAG